MECEQCQKDYERISQHWSLSGDCYPPAIGDYRHELISGLLMSDGWIKKRTNASFSVAMTNKKFLKWLKKELGFLSTDIRVKKTQEPNRDKLYVLSTISHPELNRYRDWYVEGDKTWSLPPKGLTPTRMKMLYVGDGNKYTHNKGRDYIRIGASNQLEYKDETLKLFESLGLEPRWSTHNIVFSVEDSEKLWDYMGEAPPGFEYKW